MNKGRSWHKLLLCLFMGGSLFASDAEVVPGEYLVKLKKGSVQSIEILARTLGAGEVNIVNSEEGIIKVTKSMLERVDYSIHQLSESEVVEIVEPNYIYTIGETPNDSDLEKLWGLINTGQEIGRVNGKENTDIDADLAWDMTTGSEDVLVAVIDTGVDYTHEDIAANHWVNQAEKDGEEGVDDDGNGYVDDIYGYDFANDDGDPMDDNDHGTHCAGTIGGVGNNEIGVAGVAWKVKIMGVKFLSGFGGGSLENAIKAIDYATKNGAQIMNNSWGGGSHSELLKEAIERSKEAGVLFVAAAGNSASNNDKRPAYPASYDVDNIVSVAATTNIGRLASFSNYGATKVHVAAPGKDVYSTVAGNKYKMLSGTSMAAPHVTGLAVLLKSHNPDMTFTEMKERMMKTSRPQAALRGKVASNGLVNAYNALTDTVPDPDPEDPFYWDKVDYELSTPHPYPKNYEAEFTVTVEGAKKMALYFEKFNLENRYDKLTLEDVDGNKLAEYTGNLGSFYTAPVEGDTVILKVKADKSVQKYGFDLTKVAVQMNDEEPPGEEPPGEEPPGEEPPGEEPPGEEPPGEEPPGEEPPGEEPPGEEPPGEEPPGEEPPGEEPPGEEPPGEEPPGEEPPGEEPPSDEN